MTQRAPSNVESLLYYMPPCYAVNTHTHKHTHARTHTHILSRAMKMHPAVTCWNWVFEGDTSKSSSNANTCKADTFHKSPEEAELVCVCVYVYVACVPVNPPLLSSFWKWPLFTCHISLPPPIHTHAHTVTAVQCSIKSWLFISVVHTLLAQNQRDWSQRNNEDGAIERDRWGNKKKPLKSEKEDEHPAGKFGSEGL